MKIFDPTTGEWVEDTSPMFPIQNAPDAPVNFQNQNAIATEYHSSGDTKILSWILNSDSAATYEQVRGDGSYSLNRIISAKLNNNGAILKRATGIRISNNLPRDISDTTPFNVGIGFCISRDYDSESLYLETLNENKLLMITSAKNQKIIEHDNWIIAYGETELDREFIIPPGYSLYQYENSTLNYDIVGAFVFTHGPQYFNFSALYELK